jgi:hypothetical protein
MCSENLNIFVKLFSLLYADDTIILPETEVDKEREQIFTLPNTNITPEK